jgi:hypothetical protein
MMDFFPIFFIEQAIMLMKGMKEKSESKTRNWVLKGQRRMSSEPKESNAVENIKTEVL